MVGMVVACLGLVMIAVYQASIKNLIINSPIDDTLLKITLVTADDYSIQATLPPELFDYFQERHKETFESHLTAFKMMLESQIHS